MRLAIARAWAELEARQAGGPVAAAVPRSPPPPVPGPVADPLWTATPTADNGWKYPAGPMPTGPSHPPPVRWGVQPNVRVSALYRELWACLPASDRKTCEWLACVAGCIESHRQLRKRAERERVQRPTVYTDGYFRLLDDKEACTKRCLREAGIDPDKFFPPEKKESKK